MRAMNAFTLSLSLVVATLCATAADAAQFLVRAGDDWSTLKPKLKPGDEIILMPGKHRSVRFEDLAGEEGKPIVIRSPDEKAISTIFATEIGIHLVRCKYIRVDHVAISGGKRAGIVVAGDGDGRSSHIMLDSVYVTKTGDEGEQCGVRIERVDHVTMKDCRIEAWHRAGVHIHGSTDVALNGVQFVASPATADEYAAVIDGASSSVMFQRCRFGAGIGTSIALGPTGTGALPSTSTGPDGSEPKEKPVLVDGVTVERCLSKRNGTFISYGSCSGALVRANTIIDAGCAYSVLEPPKAFAQVRSATFLANLIAWSPGAMKSFCKVHPGADPAGLVVETNLWYSAELPLAKPILGEFLGTLKAEQMMTVDPNLDGYDRPREEKAQSFGWTSA